MCVCLCVHMQGLLEGKGLEGALKKAESSFLPTYIYGTYFWPIANAVNFKFVPCQPIVWRLIYINLAGLAWNTFLRWISAQKHSNRFITSV